MVLDRRHSLRGRSSSRGRSRSRSRRSSSRSSGRRSRSRLIGIVGATGSCNQ
ncbi:MAG: hypothetical protein H8D48_05415 [Actinobacteria bacterium]|nr:hypothetical protein [Actinomycetota bacterium]